MMKQTFLFICVSISVLCSSCITNKDVVYLQDKGTVKQDSLLIKELSKPYRVQVNDILSINVKALDNELTAIFNPVGANHISTAQGQAGLYFSGFTVDLHGNIKFPILGEINVLGFTIKEIEEKVKKELLAQYFKESAELFVTVKLAGLRYTTIGEVGTGVHTLFQDRVNILEALANAGDISQTGDRKDVLVIRQYPDGQKIHHIDLTDIAAMDSPYYYIQPNDIILVKPLRRKSLGAGQTAIQNITTMASILSVLVSTYFLTRNL
ncbi:Polysaccharide biosynthesis/export protein [Mariniflexile rhizosphaerae]|uniref:polysaccharide biosynthesis/export family protein n=1 Tax=unclassified Mariniflexile TaxID=2643887 RepID=UPI000CA8937E|nr:polysaccharide biosynthesis/export family protein [Mariniflexile sp. TRM1-10]AXP79290.1 Polysaccharide biosynthesis/export protein [Mariniflexile sp. TRM1-10]PLB17894.1 MAG: Polysaccharide export protein [Flavobacteriaceae bacterium FS1-H7996/R]